MVGFGRFSWEQISTNSLSLGEYINQYLITAWNCNHPGFYTYPEGTCDIFFNSYPPTIFGLLVGFGISAAYIFNKNWTDGGEIKY